MAGNDKVERRFVRALKSSGLVKPEDIERAYDVQQAAQGRGLELPIDRILLKLQLLDREQILGLWRALRYYLWRREDKQYVKIALQSKLLTPEMAKSCLREQKNAYKHEDELVRVNEIARQRGYVKAPEDRAIVEAMHRLKPVTLRPVADDHEGPADRPSPGAARKGVEPQWRKEAQRKDLAALREHIAGSQSSGDGHGVSDPDLDALWDEADLDDVELDSQAVEISQAPLQGLEDSGEDEDIELPD